MSVDLQGQVALVTGAARGIGRACAVALAQAGADIILGLRDVNSGGDVADEIRQLGRQVLPVQLNTARLAEIQEAVEAGYQHFGRIDVLINNAGIGFPARAEAVTEAEFDETLAVNLKGTFFTAQAVGRIMIEQRRPVSLPCPPSRSIA